MVGWRDTHGIPMVIEGTWRNKDTVLNEALEARGYRRRAQAVLLAAPVTHARLSILLRYYLVLAATGVARWTPSEAEERTISSLSGDVRAIAGSTFIGCLTVVDRSGMALYDGSDAEAFVRTRETASDRPLTGEGTAVARRGLGMVRRLAATQPGSPAETGIRAIEETLR